MCRVPQGQPPPHIHASMSSTSLVCTTIARLHHTIQEVLLNYGNCISSICADLVAQLQLHTSYALPIKILFKNTHISNTQYLVSPTERIHDIRRILSTFPLLSTPPAKPPLVCFLIHHTIPNSYRQRPPHQSPLDHECIDNAVKTMLQ